MLLKTKGIPHLVDRPLIGAVTRSVGIDQPDRILIAEQHLPEATDLGRFRAVLTDLDRACSIDMPSVYAVSDFGHLVDGDIIAIHSDGAINTLYRVDSVHNFLLFTERCNSNCLMCSQPPRNRDDIRYLHGIYKELIPLIPKDCVELGITGGEPTLMGDLFFDLLEQLKEELPNTDLHCLTNGRSFAWPNIARKLGEMQCHNLMLGIPLYSDFYQQHDYIVQAKEAFNQTMQGLYNLAVYNQRIEIRIVLHQQTIPRLTRLAKFIYKNLPFVEHVAFMGLEHQGYTPYNIDKLWIDPIHYMAELGEAVMFLSNQGLNVSIYNTQLCLLPEILWPFARKSISDWKNIYLEACVQCEVKDQCGGLFASAGKMHSAFITPRQLSHPKENIYAV